MIFRNCLAFWLVPFSVFSQNSIKIVPLIPEKDFIQDFKNNLPVSESDLRKIPVDTLLLQVRLTIDSNGKAIDGIVENDEFNWTSFVKRNLANVSKFKVPASENASEYRFEIKYPNPYLNDETILEPKYPVKGGVNKLKDRFADEMDVYFRLENVGTFTLVYFVETDGRVKDFVYEENASKALVNYTKRFFKRIEKFEPAYQFGNPIRHKMFLTFTIVEKSKN